jgi:protein-tyrosine kinase
MSDIKLDPRLVAVTGRSSFIAEQYRGLRAKILLATKESTKRTFLLTSAVPGEGKTLTSVNLAMTIAQGVQGKVLLVDTDLRHPSIHSFLGINPERGLTNYLTEDIEIESVILNGTSNKLALLPAGKPVPNPSELLESEKMRSLMKGLKRHYPDRIIILDSPPIIPTSETSVLANMVDWIIFIILAGKTPRETVTRALSSYKLKNVLGIVLNKLETLPQEYSYGYKDKNYYAQYK